MASTLTHYKYNPTFYKAKAIVLALFPLVLLLLPADTFDNGKDFCLFTILSGYHCWGCGLTRACMHMIHLDFVTAEAYNIRVFIVLPMLCIMLLVEFVRTIMRYRKLMKKEKENTANKTEGTL
ncbi:hypothetical protein CJD36_009325 [Flavipsychrobacter stenotrophus]|uniref:DUF2752 domain-containing protein n=1 Tax=Flavipsychrobacter stenotrophus TaxID=2077091 RepID=A0A2S7SZE5_9BACT|nr:DUF2752 domain-containing protein [Flavipsychrobacter stenotrophus]PQJ11981.1 hypothetical protein CJD36_009325 [Flavipsychrobacter stenotrophus]